MIHETLILFINKNIIGLQGSSTNLYILELLLIIISHICFMMFKYIIDAIWQSACWSPNNHSDNHNYTVNSQWQTDLPETFLVPVVVQSL